jgi:hypothetical protein
MGPTTLSVDTALLSSTFLPIVGGTMAGPINFTTSNPSSANELVNKAYVDAQISSFTIPDATATVAGKMQLAGDLTGTAAAPTIANAAITNVKMANMTSTSRIKGSGTGSSAVADIPLGPSMSMTGNTLNSGVSFVAGINPNVTAPTDRPSTSNIAYIGNNGSVWLWNGSTYTSLVQTGVQTYLRVLADITLPGNVVTPLTLLNDLTYSLPPNSRTRAKYMITYSTTYWGDSINCGFPNNSPQLSIKGIMFLAPDLARDGTKPEQAGFCNDFTGSNGILTQQTTPDATAAGTHCYLMDLEIVNTGATATNWTIAVVPSNFSSTSTRKVLAGSSVVFSSF